MSTQNSNFSLKGEEFDAVTLCQLNAKPRYPLTPAEWLNGYSLPEPRAIGFVGELQFEQVIDWKARFPVAPIIAELFAAPREAFEEAAYCLTHDVTRTEALGRSMRSGRFR